MDSAKELHVAWAENVSNISTNQVIVRAAMSGNEAGEAFWELWKGYKEMRSIALEALEINLERKNDE